MNGDKNPTQMIASLDRGYFSSTEYVSSNHNEIEG